jgi:cytochrome c oxidase subunit 2
VKAGARRLVPGAVAAFALAFAPSFFASADGGDASPTRTFAVTASRYAFDPDRIEVRQGDHVMLVLRSADTTHGLGIEAYGVEVVIPKGGEEVSVEFMAHRPGTFRIKCSEYCGSGHRRMQGRLVVAEAGQ